MSIERIEKLVKYAPYMLVHYRGLVRTFRPAAPRLTYVHLRCQCVNCGNECIDQADVTALGTVRFLEVSPSGYCFDCRSVLADYGYYDEFDEDDEDDEYGRTYTCDSCGGEYGDGWSTCICDDDDHWYWYSLPAEVADDEAN
jgi:hypothetical protein